ncbi:2-oxoglutaramate amidase [Actinomadura rubteroloni]|uniref:2-oxoglutaramate amidase n=1 Tax=Actinomadura rubteroloni TaxID=1926885 RepID=A0A2P4URG5_9ACTN|nr:carbon-nitrogen hydrolase family protein [Actinomadura rubteroloni]POM27641.1 2-oxoglutaramate amidase [Actinomadura rubteroloni]
MVRIAVAQFEPGMDKDANRDRVADLVASAAARDARVVVLPEYSMFTAPRMDERFVTSAEPLDGPFVAAVAASARKHGVHVVAGFAERTGDPERASNTLVAVAPDGDVAASYRKTHLFDAFGYRESDFLVPGPLADPELFTVDDLTFGLQTCYDVRFPEVTRRIVDAGADVLALPAEWVPGPLKEDHWRTLVRARAIENTIYVAAADQCGRAGAGNSMIVDPMGIVVASLGEAPGVAVGEIERERVASVRGVNPALELRRFTVIPR